MFKHYTKTITLLVAMFLTNLVQAGAPFSSIFIFGDSLSDTGNLASVLGDLPLPFFDNRISNGLVAIETVSAHLSLNSNASKHLIVSENGTNYSVAGASASGVKPIDLNAQVISFQTNHNFVAPNNALYVIFIGGNDLRSASRTTDILNAKKKILSAVEQVKKAIITLEQSGARSFLIINSLDIGGLPETKRDAVKSNDLNYLSRAHSLSAYYRNTLHELVISLRSKESTQLIEFDLFKFFVDLLQHGENYGFTNTNDACFNTSNLTFHPDCDYGMNFDKFIFFDKIHPSARAHKLIGDAIFQRIEETTQ